MNGQLITVKNMFQIGPEGVPYAPSFSRHIRVSIRVKKRTKKRN